MGSSDAHNKDLISEWIERSPWKPGADEVRIRGTGIPVWALIGYLPAVDNDPERVGHDYELPVEALQAAIAYYHEHQVAIDARLAQNAAFVD